MAKKPTAAHLSDRAREVLADMQDFGHVWMRPMDIGARDASHHSGTLSRLFKRGLVDRRERGSLGPRSSYEYTLTDLGRTALSQNKSA